MTIGPNHKVQNSSVPAKARLGDIAGLISRLIDLGAHSSCLCVRRPGVYPRIDRGHLSYEDERLKRRTWTGAHGPAHMVRLPAVETLVESNYNNVFLLSCAIFIDSANCFNGSCTMAMSHRLLWHTQYDNPTGVSALGLRSVELAHGVLA